MSAGRFVLRTFTEEYAMQKRPALLMFSGMGRIFMAALLLLALTGNASAASAGRIYCQGTELMADGTRIYLNGANTP